jgi:hypothetical protein
MPTASVDGRAGNEDENTPLFRTHTACLPQHVGIPSDQDRVP